MALNPNQTYLKFSVEFGFRESGKRSLAQRRKGRQGVTENEIGKLVVDSAVTVHRELGPGLLETVYEVILAHELRQRGLRVERGNTVQKSMGNGESNQLPLAWASLKMGTFWIIVLAHRGIPRISHSPIVSWP